MYIDEDIKLRDDLPKQLLDSFEQLKVYYDKDDWLQFDLLFEVVEGTVKGYYLTGTISRQDLDLIFKKYGIA